MNILIVTGGIPYPKARTGAAVVMSGELATLATRHAITLVTFAPTDDAERAALAHWRASGVVVHAAGENIPTALVRLKRDLERRLNRLRGRDPRSCLEGPDPRLQRVIDSVLRDQTFDIVQMESIGVGTYEFATGAPKVLTEHEVGRSSASDRDAWRHRQPVLWRRFDRIQVFTARDAAALADAAPDLATRVRINPFGVDLPAVIEPNCEEPKTLVFIGGFDHAPNRDAARWLVRDIMPLVQAVHSDAKLFVVGEASREDVEALAGPSVILTGPVATVDPYLERAALAVAPVRIGGGMRRKVLHAMALGKAVVTTRLGAEGLMGAPQDLPLVLADTTSDFAGAIARLIEDAGARRELGARARAFVSAHHSWAAYRDRLERTYAEMCSP